VGVPGEPQHPALGASGRTRGRSRRASPPAGRGAPLPAGRAGPDRRRAPGGGRDLSHRHRLALH
jgi:hypothetical protein